MPNNAAKSIADIEAELWKKGVCLEFAYLSDVWASPLRVHGKKIDPELLEKFRDRVLEAQGKKVTGRQRSDPLGELGELFAAIMFGIDLHAPRTEGSDGMLGSDFVEVKTITPEKKRDSVRLKRTGNFSKVVVVKITKDFQFGARMISRRSLKKGRGVWVELSWDDMILGAGERALEAHRNFPMVRCPLKILKTN